MKVLLNVEPFCAKCGANLFVTRIHGAPSEKLLVRHPENKTCDYAGKRYEIETPALPATEVAAPEQN